MKANEIEDGKVLMIGDLVVGCFETDIVGKATYKILCKVTDINHYGDVSCEALKPFPDELDWQDGDDFSWIEPIPLTAEILEKNGFKKCDGNEWSVFKYEDDDYTKKALYQVLWSADELYLEIDSYTSRTGEFNRMGVEFVHELQHALRLCGITCEIIL